MPNVDLMYRDGTSVERAFHQASPLTNSWGVLRWREHDKDGAQTGALTLFPRCATDLDSLIEHATALRAELAEAERMEAQAATCGTGFTEEASIGANLPAGFIEQHGLIDPSTQHHESNSDAAPVG